MDGHKYDSVKFVYAVYKSENANFYLRKFDLYLGDL